MRSALKIVCGVLIGLVALSGCVNKAEPPVIKRYVVVGEEPTPPEGVVRYCWEEPIVKREKQGPGLDTEGKWYKPAHVAVREVRMGKWRPCKQKVATQSN